MGTNTATKPPTTTSVCTPIRQYAPELREHDRMLRRLAEAQNARPRLLQILVAWQLRQNGRLQAVHDLLGEKRLGDEPRQEARECEQDDRQDRRHGRPGAEGVRDERRQGLEPAAQDNERLAQDEAEHDKGISKRTPPRIVVPTKREIGFIRSASESALSRRDHRSVPGSFKV